MDRAELKRKLSGLEGFENPSTDLEQYVTPPGLAADLLWQAEMSGDLEDDVADLGAGTGVLGLGAALLGAEATLVEKDPGALELAHRNAENLDLEAEFVEEDVRDYEVDEQTVVMNPPFSVHTELLEQFLQASLGAEAVYTVAPPDGGVEEFYSGKGYTVEAISAEVALTPTFGFHTEEAREIEVRLVSATID